MFCTNPLEHMVRYVPGDVSNSQHIILQVQVIG